MKRKNKKNNHQKIDVFNQESPNSKVGLFEKSPSSTVKDL